MGAHRWEGTVIVYLKYQADIWVEVDTSSQEVSEAVVDESSMAHPVEARLSTGVDVASAMQLAEEIANGIEWPSWDYRPTAGPRRSEV
ncbi:MAG: hypothetical protein ACT452_02780 [Microthrixaceae bacterium]